MITPLEADEMGAPGLAPMTPELVSHLEGNFDRSAAVVGVKDPPALPGSSAQQQFRQLDRRDMGDAREVHMIERLRGFVHGRQQNRISMAMQNRPPRGNAVDDLAAIIQEKKFILGPDADQGRIRLTQRSVGMPDRLAIAINKCRAARFSA